MPAEFWLCYRPFGDDRDVVRMMDEARAAIVADTASAAIGAGHGRVRVFSTVDIADLPLGVDLQRTEPEQCIGDVVADAAAGADHPVIYAGSGMPAMTAADWSGVLEATSRGAVANRMFSSDWVGVADGRSLSNVAGERSDNRFARILRDEGGFHVQSHPRSARSLLDVDTPADLALLEVCGAVGSLILGPRLTEILQQWRDLLEGAATCVAEVCDTMTDHDGELFVAGRVSGAEMAAVDRDTSCRVRVLSEERGLRARDATAAASVLGMLYKSRGAKAFVEALSELGDAMIWDTRPFWAHLGWSPSRADRFQSDLGSSDEIEHAPLRELVGLLSERRMITGGHSLVSGGLLASIDQAWTRAELEGRWPRTDGEASPS